MRTTCLRNAIPVAIIVASLATLTAVEVYRPGPSAIQPVRRAEPPEVYRPAYPVETVPLPRHETPRPREMRGGVEESRRPQQPDAQPIAAVDLGRLLFHDPRLSANGRVSCATCHPESKAFASGGLPIGVSGKRLTRQAPTLINRHLGKSHFWDGRAATLEEQIAGPLTNPDEMGMTPEKVVSYVTETYPSDPPLTFDTVCHALAEFTRTIQVTSGPWDDYVRGVPDALTQAEARGWNLFRGKAECWRCHPGSRPGDNFTDESFRNTGVGVYSDGRAFRIDDSGRARVTRLSADVGRFKVPTLRAVRHRAPYMHDASIPSLEAVVDFYGRGGVPNKNLDKDIFPLRLNRQEIRDLLAFLHVL
jgi:cytochrome c peroxidase